nr:ATP synthase F0 subunit 6 [Pingus sinensis]
MNNLNFLDIFLFAYLAQFLFYFKDGLMGELRAKLYSASMKGLNLDPDYPLSVVFSSCTLIFVSVCLFFGFMPYCYCPFSVFEFVFAFSLVSWVGALMTYMSSEKFALYASVDGSPIFFTFFVAFAEIFCGFSRPLALSLRLFVNVWVGRLLMGCVYFCCDSFGFGYFLISLFVIFFEFFVFTIQTYVFALLINMYLDE